MSLLDMSNSNNPPPPPPNLLTKDLFPSPSPALSLSLAGIFRDGPEKTNNNMDVEGGDEAGSMALVEISSENSGPAKSRSEDEFDVGEAGDDNGDGDDQNKKRKRKKYHRHTPDQIREMEALFKESPHPDEKQRQQLSQQLGLHPRQVKFWFQNRRTQIKAIQERHENTLLKTEMDKLRDENKALRETIKMGCCPNCGFASSSKDAALTSEEQHLRHENGRLKAEVEKLRTMVGKYPNSASHSPTSSSCSAGNDQENRSSLDFYSGVFGLEKPRIMEIVNVAMEELTKMAFAGEPLWIRSYETGREILNYDEYMKMFPYENPGNGLPKRSIEASRESGMVIVDLPRLVKSFMDVNQWQEMFPGMISKAKTINVISNGEGDNRDGGVQLMFAELQMLTPLVGTKEVCFVRYCKQLNADQWAIVDVSIDKVENSIDSSLVKCRKRPSGCIIEDKSNGHCKVTWVEHLECQKSVVHSMYRSIVNSGLAFGARHWMATLQLQCERLVFFLATNVPTKDSSGVTTLAGRKSTLKLAQRMTSNFCRAVGASSYHKWNKIPSKTGADVRIASRKNLVSGEPAGVIMCAVSSIWLPVPHVVLFDFLRDETRRDEWDVMANGGPVQSVANLAKGQDRGNAVSIQTMKSKENMLILQESCTNSYESMVVYALVDVLEMQSVMKGCDPTDIAILPSGFAILPDGLESRPLVITSKPEEKSTEGGSLLTIAYQVLISNKPNAKLSMEAVESVSNLISCTLRNIKTSLQCDDQ